MRRSALGQEKERAKDGRQRTIVERRRARVPWRSRRSLYNMVEGKLVNKRLWQIDVGIARVTELWSLTRLPRFSRLFHE